ncbi:MAG: HPF/RaiA family ribosome-associated protein [Treponemataceae bacterium]|nr:HPF/RaiA family ribosome-associated protein [Treponemataceae bacterium]
METTINAVGFILDQDQTDLINKKLERIKYAEDLIVTCAVKVKEDKKFTFDATVHFKWGAQAHVENDDYDFAACLNKLMDMLDNKIKKEKDKIQK